MPLIPFLRALFSFAGLILIAALGYLAWTWCQGEVFIRDDGLAYRVREDWRLWTVFGLVAFSLFGRVVLLTLLTRPDTDRSEPVRSSGQMVLSPTGSELYVEAEGDEAGPVLIATHGWGLDSTIWHYLKRDLAAQRAKSPHQLIVWDLPGAGRSKAPSLKQVSLTSFARDLDALIQGVSPRPVILLGHSIGGMTIQTLARDLPQTIRDRVAGIVLINTTYTNPLETMVLSRLFKTLRRPLLEPVFKLTILLKPLAWFSAWQGYLNGTAHLANRIQFAGAVTRSQLDHTSLLGTRNSPAVLARGNLAMFDWDATGALRTVPCPVLVIAGEQDLVTKLEAGGTIAEQAGRAEFERVGNANHMGFLEQAPLYNARIADFLADHGDGLLTPSSNAAAE